MFEYLVKYTCKRCSLVFFEDPEVTMNTQEVFTVTGACPRCTTSNSGEGTTIHETNGE
jgi:hypothetical protein